MSKKAFDNIMAGLQDAVAYAEGDLSRGRTQEYRVPVVDVRSARTKLGLSLNNFAATFGISVDTVRHWEQGQLQPTGLAQTLLAIIDREPEAVKRALSA